MGHFLLGVVLFMLLWLKLLTNWLHSRTELYVGDETGMNRFWNEIWGCNVLVYRSGTSEYSRRPRCDAVSPNRVTSRKPWIWRSLRRVDEYFKSCGIWRRVHWREYQSFREVRGQPPYLKKSFQLKWNFLKLEAAISPPLRNVRTFVPIYTAM